MPGDQRPQRERGHVGNALQPAERIRDGNHHDPKDREPPIDASHENRIPLNGGPERRVDASHTEAFPLLLCRKRRRRASRVVRRTCDSWRLVEPGTTFALSCRGLWVAVDREDAPPGIRACPARDRASCGSARFWPLPAAPMSTPPRAPRRPCCSPQCATPRRRMNRQSLHSLLFHVGLCAAPVPRPTASCPLLPPYIRTCHEANPNAPLPGPVRPVTSHARCADTSVFGCPLGKRIPTGARRPCTRLNRCRCSLRARLPVRRRWRSLPGCRTTN